MRLNLYFFSIVFLFLFSCTASQKLKSTLPTEIEKSPVFQKSFTGFALYDPQKEQMIYEHNADKYFTPASNTKIFTLYTSLNILGDLIPALEYVEQGDSLIFWGTGDPSFLNPFFENGNFVFDFLKNRKENLYFCPYNFQDERYGSGWAWDDFPYYYQPEKSPFPIYGNVATFERDTLKNGFEVQPPLFKNYVTFNTNLKGERPIIVRGENDNNFEHNAKAITGKAFEKQVPFHYSHEFFLTLLQDTLKRKVNLLDVNITPAAFPESEELTNTTAVKLYKELMQESDNFIAEQLMLLCSNRLFGTMQTEKAIKYAKDSLLRDLPDVPQWVDGSGLSRYNMFTPRSIVKLLEKVQQKLPQAQLFSIFPAGGVSGTIKNWYGNEDGNPYVFAKTGTLRHKHCLSGYLKTKKGKVLIFSFMHNNFPTSSTPLKIEMQRILKNIYEAF